MGKKLENMTTDERIAYWDKQRAKLCKERQECVNKLQPSQQAALYQIESILDRVLDVALYPDMGGIKMVSAYDLQELSDAKDTLQFQFNLKGE